MKDSLKNHNFAFDQLLENVPGRPGRVQPPWKYNPRYDMLGLLAKYNLEYRRPYPLAQNAPFETWSDVCWAELQKEEVIDRLNLPEFNFSATAGALSASTIWSRGDADWRWHTSMMVSLHAVSDDEDYWIAIRQVLAISFPGFCWLLRISHTASDIEAAWLRLPTVRCGKAARGTNAGKSKRARN